MHAPEFTLNREAQAQQAMGLYSANPQFLQHSKSSGNIQQQLQLAAAKRHAVQMANLAASRTIFVQHPLRMQQIGTNLTMSPKSLSFANSSNGNSENVSFDCRFLLFPPKKVPQFLSFSRDYCLQSAPRVKFALDPPTQARNASNAKDTKLNPPTLQRSKSLSSADALARGIAGLGLGIATESNDIGTFKAEIQAIIDQALIDPNKLNARSLMVLANQIMQRAVEGRR